MADLPGPSWGNLAAKLVLQPHKLVHQLLQQHGASSLLVQPDAFTGLITPSTHNSAKTTLLRQPSSGDPTHTLMAMGGQVAALCDLQEMFEFDPEASPEGPWAPWMDCSRPMGGHQLANP
jgi:hypothetical protein